MKTMIQVILGNHKLSLIENDLLKNLFQSSP